MILWASLTVALFGLLPVHTWAEVVNSFQPCSEFFYNGGEPVGFDQNAKKICQMLTEYSWYFYATLYSTHHRIPLYSAYTFNYDCRNSQDGRKSGDWFIEPQLSDFTFPAHMDKESNYNSNVIKARQAINADYYNTGYDRGHLNPNSFQCDAGCTATFTLTNSAPMDACFNRVQWKAWEASVREILLEQDRSGTAYLVTGAVPDSDNRIPKQGIFDEDDARDFDRVTVPTHIWTAVCYIHPTDEEKSFSFGYIGVNEPHGSIVPKTVPQLTAELSRLYRSNNLKIFEDDCFFSRRKSEEMVKNLYKHVLKHLGDRVNVSQEIMNILNTALSRSNNGGTSSPAKIPKIKEVKIDLVYSDEQEWFMEMEEIKFVSGLACSLSRPISMSVITGHDELRHRRETTEELVCTLVPENSEGCTTSCLYREEDGLYYCSTGTTTIQCSPTYSDITVSGEKCRNGHTCGLHGYEYYWCYTGESWDYCSPPLPLGVTKSGKRCSAKRNCAKYSTDHSTRHLKCETEDGREEEECCRRADRFSALNDRNCKPESPCKYHDDSYGLWCYTTDGTWDYCCTP